MNLIPIGRFSRMTRLSVKALRLYDEIGLLPPAQRRPVFRIQYYDLGQANRAAAARILRVVEIPLDEILRSWRPTTPNWPASTWSCTGSGWPNGWQLRSAHSPISRRASNVRKESCRTTSRSWKKHRS